MSVQRLATDLARLLQREVTFCDEPADTALLASGQLGQELFGYPTSGPGAWCSGWPRGRLAGGTRLDKPDPVPDPRRKVLSGRGSAVARCRRGLVLPACPLAIDERRKLDERRQRALVRYYLAAGAGGIAVGVHTTQFAVHDPAVGILEPLLGLVSEEFRRSGRPDLVGVAGVMGDTRTACREAGTARELGYDAALVMLPASRAPPRTTCSDHCAAVAEELPIIGFYLQNSVGGRPLGHAFWRRLFDLDRLVAVKIAPFNRYATLDVVRALW